MKSRFIAWILLLVFAATVFNVLRQRWPAAVSTDARSFLLHYVEPVDAALCSVRGYRCPDSDCDCDVVCGPGGFEKLAVLPGEDVILHDVKLKPGTYCVPSGFETCHQKSSVFVYSASGWFCAPRNGAVWQGDRMIACKNSRARDDSLNVLVDVTTDREVDGVVENFYERLPDGSFRYRCRCGSLDGRGNAMVATLLFTCSEDFCLRELSDTSPQLGWKEDRCVCGVYGNSDPDDPTSPCTERGIRLREDTLTGRVRCMDERSFSMEPILCPRAGRGLSFEKRVGRERYGSDFVSKNMDVYQTLVEAKEYPDFTQTYKVHQWQDLHYGPPGP